MSDCKTCDWLRADIESLKEHSSDILEHLRDCDKSLKEAQVENARLMRLVHGAFDEGFDSGRVLQICKPSMLHEQKQECWSNSSAKRQVEVNS